MRKSASRIIRRAGAPEARLIASVVGDRMVGRAAPDTAKGYFEVRRSNCIRFLVGKSEEKRIRILHIY